MHAWLTARGLRQSSANVCGVMLLALGVAPFAIGIVHTSPQPAAATGVLDKLRAGAPLQLGYRTDARPFSFRDESGLPAGYSVDLCHRIIDAVKSEPGLSGVTATWVPVTAGDRFSALESGKIHIFCGADTITAERKNQVAFSVPIFPGGIGALVRADAPSRLREVLLTGGRNSNSPAASAGAANPSAAGAPPSAGAASPPRQEDVQTLLMRAFTAVNKTTSAAWLRSRIKDFGVQAFVLPVESFDYGVEQLLGNKTDAFFAERAMLLDTTRRHPSGRMLAVIDRFYTQESLALAFPRGDEPWRQLADRALGKLYASGEVGNVYEKWFGALDEPTREFFRTIKPSE